LLPLMVVQRKILARAPEDRSDVAAFPPWLDQLLFGITEVERRVARLWFAFPVGGSVLVTATRQKELKAKRDRAYSSAVAA
jgi:hypothetical protein